MEIKKQTVWEVSEELGIQRLKVFGGWLVKRNENFMIKMQQGKIIGSETAMPVNGMLAMTFVPDPAHEWKFEEAYNQ